MTDFMKLFFFGLVCMVMAIAFVALLWVGVFFLIAAFLPSSYALAATAGLFVLGVGVTLILTRQ